jgi:PIN domain nuclease of toxin-antitoxin system
MNLLLDTCAFLWIAKNDANLSAPALEAFRCADNAVFLSSVSAWEISVKWSMGKLALPYPPPQFIPRERKRHFINKLPFTEKDTFHLASLLVCQDIENGLTILTADQHIRQYPVQTLW